MKKLILLFILTLFGMSRVVAQDNNPSQTSDLKAYVDSLSTKLNTLQHDYDYLYCRHEINQLQSELNDLQHDVNIRSNAILISCYHGGYDSGLYSAYRSSYNALVDLYDSVKERIEVGQRAVRLKILSSNFTQNEIDVLMKGCGTLDRCLSTLQSSLDYCEFVLGMYRDLK
ncbi:hypothetical protein [Barnesiella intestinihominis]|uniref:Uncharacterized protein n=1 Tax=Barnesiella intestinihominis YIT 11860 TaxID=742726 RepID=K0X3G3_9BACT|nr:hypothetical protein [Barnesiella intestinihominis]EJZ65878.1 hypothetical protein HMPREF9448_00048 [Barnesiella intestinihominis YIT 11860]